MLESAEPSMSARIEVADLFGYRDWRQSNGLDALTADAFGDALNKVAETADIEAVRSRGRVYLIGLRFAAQHSTMGDCGKACNWRPGASV